MAIIVHILGVFRFTYVNGNCVYECVPMYLWFACVLMYLVARPPPALKHGKWYKSTFITSISESLLHKQYAIKLMGIHALCAFLQDIHSANINNN